MKKNIDVAGAVVLITGAARGMGRLWARSFGADGARLVLWDVDSALLEETAEEFSRKGWPVYVQTVDVTNRKAVYAAAKKVAKEFGVVDILVNNAGIVSAGRFLEVPDEKLEATIEVDLKALLWTIKAFLPGMITRDKGVIFNISSASGFIGVPFMPAYAASKWGVIGLTESLRLEMELTGHKGVRFALFCPSYVDTGMFKGVKPPRLVPLLSPEEAVRRGYAGLLQGRYLIVEPLLAKFTPSLKALLPRPVFDFINGYLGVTTSMKNWTGRSR